MIETLQKGSLIFLIVMSLITGCPVTDAQSIPAGGKPDYLPVISNVSVLSIHVRDTLVHDSIFHFLTDVFGLAVEYYPVKWLDRKYAGVYAGNMYLEPCGPFSNFRYASNNFKAIFFGLNCESGRSLASIAEDLTSRNIGMEQTGTIQVTDTSVIRQNIYFSIASAQAPGMKTADSLRKVMHQKNENKSAIEGISEIRVGYSDENAFIKWKELAKPAIISHEGIWKINGNQSIRFAKSSINEVSGIVFRVNSLKKAKAWFMKNNLMGADRGNEIELDPSKTFGLRIILNEK